MENNSQKFNEVFVCKLSVEEATNAMGGKEYIISGPCAMADKPNLNNRIYPKTVLNEAIAKLRDKVSRRSVKMSLDHPDWEGKLGDCAAVMIDITDVQEDGFAYYKAQIIDTAKGKDLKAIVDHSPVGVSTRGYGESEDEMEYPGCVGKFSVLKPGFRLSNVDFVDEPSVDETEKRMMLESKNGQCYHQAENNVKKESVMPKTLEELKAEFPEIFADLEKGHVEALEALKNSIEEANKNVSAKDNKFNALVEALKAVIPEHFTTTQIAESEVITSKDTEIAALKAEIETLTKTNTELVAKVSATEAEKVKAERDTAIQTLKTSDADFFESEELVKKFENCITAEEIKKCYESIKAILVAYKPKSNEAKESKTVIDDKKVITLTEAQKKDFESRNQDRQFSNMKPMTVEEYKSKFVK